MGNKNSKSKNTQTTAVFTQNVSSVMSFLNECRTKIETESTMSSNQTNSIKSGDIKVDRLIATDGGKNVIGRKHSQSSKVNLQQSINQMITTIMNSDADSDLKLDALANIAAEAENKSAFSSTGSDSETNINVSNSIESKTINEIVSVVSASTSANVRNELDEGDIILGDVIAQGEGSLNQVVTESNQEIELVMTQLIEIINSSQHLNQIGESNSISSDIQNNLKTIKENAVAEVVDKSGNAIGNVIDKGGNALSGLMDSGSNALFKPLIIIAIVVVLICLIFGISSVFKNRNQNK